MKNFILYFTYKSDRKWVTMSRPGQKHLTEELDRVIHHIVREYEMTWIEVTGCLYAILHKYATIAYDEEDDLDGELDPDEFDDIDDIDNSELI